MPLDGGVKCRRREPFRVVRRKRAKKEMIIWEKVKVKGVNQVKRANPQERGAITLLLRRASDSWDLSLFFSKPRCSIRGGGACLAPGRGSKVPIALDSE